MIRIQNLSLARGTQRLIDGADLTLFPGERCGLVGRNGTGKSTLLAALRGELMAEQGDISLPAVWRTAYVAQETPALSCSALDYVLAGDQPRALLMAAVDQALLDERYDELGELHEQLNAIDAQGAPARAATLLHGLGFSLDDLSRPVAEFSGGWRMRLNLAQALGSRADLLLLDEPTNHLDMEAVLWLARWLVRYPATQIIVSHDRSFLDEVCTHTVGIEEQALHKCTGGYTAYERQRAEQRLQRSIQASRQQEEAQRLQSFIDRFRAKASKAKQAQSRMKRLEKLQSIALIRPPHEVDFQFHTPDRMPDPLINLVGVHCGYHADKPILRNVTLAVRPGERWGLLGQNGNGKSTLIKTLVGQLNALGGERTEGKGVVMGYFDQHQIDRFDPSDNAITVFRRMAPEAREQSLRDFLGRYQFSGDKIEQNLGSFSGGERARLALAALIWQRPQVLLLDEPTNHLDLATREALSEALLNFGGAVVIVSHDQGLFESVAEQYLRVHAGQVQVFDGDLDDYAVQIAREQADAKNLARTVSASSSVSALGPATVSSPSTAKPSQMSTFPGQVRNIKKITALEKRMDSQRERLHSLDQQIETLAAIASTPEERKDLHALTERREQEAAALDDLENEWLLLHE